MKRRHSAKRIFERLRDEQGFDGTESHVRRYVTEMGHRHREVFVPLAQPPGEAEFDFGGALVDIVGVRVKAQLAVVSLPNSDAFHVSAYPSGSTARPRQNPKGRISVGIYSTMRLDESFYNPLIHW